MNEFTVIRQGDSVMLVEDPLLTEEWPAIKGKEERFKDIVKRKMEERQGLVTGGCPYDSSSDGGDTPLTKRQRSSSYSSSDGGHTPLNKLFPEQEGNAWRRLQQRVVVGAEHTGTKIIRGSPASLLDDGEGSILQALMEGEKRYDEKARVCMADQLFEDVLKHIKATCTPDQRDALGLVGPLKLNAAMGTKRGECGWSLDDSGNSKITITLSTRLFFDGRNCMGVGVSIKAIIELICHELAHAALPVETGHEPLWSNTMIQYCSRCGVKSDGKARDSSYENAVGIGGKAFLECENAECRELHPYRRYFQNNRFKKEGSRKCRHCKKSFLKLHYVACPR